MIDLNQVNVIDNFIPQDFQDYLYKKCTIKCKWTLNNIDYPTSYASNEIKNKYIYKDNEINHSTNENFQFSNLYLSSFFPFFDFGDIDFIHLSHYIQKHLNFTYKVLPIRLKANLQTPPPNPNPNAHNAPHVDLNDALPNNYTLIYYVNDSDGDTIIFNEKYQGSPIKNFTINQKVTPQKGKAVMFPTTQFHCGSYPISSKARIVVNYNFKLIPL
jgi:hypothetical protein